MTMMMNAVRSKGKEMIHRLTWKVVRAVESLRHLDVNVWRPQAGNDIIRNLLSRPAAIGKMGIVERAAIMGYLDGRDSYRWFCNGRSVREALYTNAGLYPMTDAVYRRYCQYMIDAVLPQMDALAVFHNVGEAAFFRAMCPQAKKLHERSMETWRGYRQPWTDELEKKIVLVVHPFASTILKQYCRVNIMTPFYHIQIIKPPQHPVLIPPDRKDWFSALDSMKRQMNAIPFDIALIGAGAYSLPLAVHAKSLGKVGIHLGGATQLYFRIKGKRWDDWGIYDERWIRPLPQETPKGIEIIENGAYW